MSDGWALKLGYEYDQEGVPETVVVAASSPAARVRQWAEGIVLTRPFGTLLVAGLAAFAVYVVGFTIPYSLAAGIEQPLLQFTRITGPSFGPTIGLLVALGVLFATYATAVRVCLQLEGSRRAVAAVVLLGGIAAIALLPMYPVFSLDIFYYMSADRIWSVFHENPFVVPPLQAANDPFFPYTSWGHYPLPYGPLWPWITQSTSALGEGQVGPTLVAFKALGVGGYLACLPLVYWALSRLAPDRRLTGLCIFAWNPLVLLELAGAGHNDAVALVPAALALGFWSRRWSVASTGTAMVSFLTKATVVVLAPALCWPSFRRALEEQTLLRWLALHAGVAGALYVVAWQPFWGDGRSAGFLREADQYYDSLTMLLMTAAPASLHDVAPRAIQAVLVLGFAVFYLQQLRATRDQGKDILRVMWRVSVLYFLVISPFYSAWYMAWPTLVSALIAERRTTILTALLCIGAFGTYLVQFVLRPIAMPTVSWTEINAIGLAVAAGPFLLGLWALQPRRQAALALAATAEA